VNQGAAVLLTSVAEAERLGVPRERWVFLHGHADLRERMLLERADLGASPAAALAVRHALEVAGIEAADLATIDLYSCFPIAVFAVTDAIGLAPDDPRGLTVTGGLPFFGGPGNNYSMHAIAETVQRLRAQPGAFGLVGANGGFLSKYSAGVYSTTPAPWRPDRSAELQAELDARPAPPVAVVADGPATVETCTIVRGRGGPYACSSSCAATTRSARRCSSAPPVRATGSRRPRSGWTSCSPAAPQCCATTTSTSSSVARATCWR
jgi:acetyl-CoA C-acetyltransferase